MKWFIRVIEQKGKPEVILKVFTMALFHRKLFLLLLLIDGLNCMYDEEGPEFTDEPPSKLEFINELGTRLNCSAKGRPPPTIQWTAGDGSPLSEVPRLRYSSTTTSEGSLVFASFPAEAFRPDVHQATYRCIASNSVGTIVSRDVQLRAVVKQSYETRVQVPRTALGFPAILECVVSPNYMRDYVIVTSWVRDQSFNILPTASSSNSESLSSSDNPYQMLSDGRLLIWKVGPNEERFSFQCRTLHKLTGETSVSSTAKISTFEIDKPSRPLIQYRLSSITAKENDEVLLPCFAHGLPKPSYTWFKKEGSRLTSLVDFQSSHHEDPGEIRGGYHRSNSHRSSSQTYRHFTSGESSSTSGVQVVEGALFIKSVKNFNKGLYLCNASNFEGSELLEVELIVRVPLAVNLHPKKLSVDLGKSAEFTCSILSSSEGDSLHSPFMSNSAQIQWLKDGVPLVSTTGFASGGSRVRFLGHNKISIQAVTREDQGMYQCVAKNDYGSVQQSAQLVLGDAYPQFIYRFIEQTLQPGPAVSLKCSARGNPTPQVTWLLDGFPLPKSERFLIGQYANVYGDVISHVNITSVQVEDGGEYECAFENRAGKARHAARLNIYGQPFVREMPDILATAGQRMTIKCPVGGYPVEIIFWERDEMRLPLNDRQSISSNGTLTVEPVDRPDAGSYTCIAGNKQGALSQRTVNVKVMVPPKITPFSFAADPHVGERASIQCVVVKGDLPLIITWLKDNHPIITNLNSANALLQKSPPSGAAPYNLHNQQHSEGNTHHRHMYLMSGNLLGHSHLHHNSGANSHNNHNLRLSIRQMDEFSSVLSIPSLEPHHSGNYTCQASNSAATSTHTTSLQVNVPPRISPFSFGEGLMEGMRTQLICTTTAGDEPLKLSWWKEGKLLETSSVQHQQEDVGGGVHVSYFPPFSTILTIPNVTAKNRGNYSCQVSNLAGTALHTAQLVVTVPAKWVVEPSDQSVYVGTHVAIHCQADGFPKPAIRWKQAVGNLEKKEFREVGYRTPGVLSAENGTLIISRVTEDHEGHYLCQASNGVGPQVGKLITLIVNAAPRIRTRPPKEMVRKGEAARLRCEADGDEPIAITWNVKGVSVNETDKDGRYFVENKRGSGPGSPAISELVIQQVSLDDRGDLECSAVNSFGHDSLRISLLVQERPQPPKEFRAVEHTSRTVLISWSLPIPEVDDAHVLDFVVSYKEESENWSETTTQRKSISGDQNSLLVSGLLPAVPYHFRLQARNQLGTSEPTQVVQVTTDGEPPSGPPLYVAVEPVSSTELRISWQPPAKDQRNGEILGYSVGFRKTSEAIGMYNWTRIENEETAGSITSVASATSSSNFGASGENTGSAAVHTILGGLEKFTEYEIVILAFNQLGNGPTSPPSVAPTMEDVPGAPPSDIICSSSTAHSLTVSWEPPARKFANGNILSFRVNLEAVFAPFLEDENLSGPGKESESRVTSTNTVVHGLLPFTNYSVSVVAATAVGDGVSSSPIYCTTLESVPDAPAEIKALSTTSDSVVVSWLPPKSPNGRLLKFHVYIRILDHFTGRELRAMKKSLSPFVSTYEVGVLKRKEKYEVWVTGETRIGEGARSPSVSFTSASKVPAGIISFGKVIATPWKADVSMPCLTVGVPAPIVTWRKKGGRIIDPASNSRYVISKNSTLQIKSVQRNDNGNYSCLVKNPEGADHIVYVLHVQVPPAPPFLHTTATTSSSIRLQWKQGDNGGAHILAYVLNFRQVEGVWEEVTLHRKLSTYLVEGLSCGRTYEFFLIAYNEIGSGPPSETISVKTKGSPPVSPPAAQLLQSNTSSITLNLAAWNRESKECPVTGFVVEYKKKSASGWNLVRPQTEGTEKGLATKRVQINDLGPETEYIIRVTGSNGAGSTTTEYEISTSVVKGGLISNSFNLGRSGENRPTSGSDKTSESASSGTFGLDKSAATDPEEHFYQKMHIILPCVALFILLIISGTGSAIWFLRKRSTSSFTEESTKPAKAFAFRRADGQDLFGSGAGILQNHELGANTLGIDRDYTIIKQKFISGATGDCDAVPETADDIYPYATFHLPMKEGQHHLEREGFYPGQYSTSPRLSNPDVSSIRQMAYKSATGRRKVGKQRLSSYDGTRGTPVQKQYLSQDGNQRESDEYEESSESDDGAKLHHPNQYHSHTSSRLQKHSARNEATGPQYLSQAYQQQHHQLVMGMLQQSSDSSGTGTLKSSRFSGGGCGGTNFNEETLLVNDKRSLSRGPNSKLAYGASSRMLSPSSGVYGTNAGGRSNGSSGGSSVGSRGGGNAHNTTGASSTDETSFILLSSGVGSGAPSCASAASIGGNSGFLPYEQYDGGYHEDNEEDYDLLEQHQFSRTDLAQNQQESNTKRKQSQGQSEYTIAV